MLVNTLYEASPSTLAADKNMQILFEIAQKQVRELLRLTSVAYLTTRVPGRLRRWSEHWAVPAALL